MTGQFQLTEDQLAIQDMAQRFTADNITPHAGEWDQTSHFPIDVIKQTAELGFGAIYVSEESGGIGLGRLEAALIMETEIWPNLYRGCGIRNIPLILVSARISPRSVPGYRKLLPLIRETLSHGIIIAAQSQLDADRFLSLGANPERTCVMGNIKFDVESDPEVIEQGRALRAELFGERPVWIAASTHDGEEQIVLDVHRELLERHSDLVLVLVPRHPER